MPYSDYAIFRAEKSKSNKTIQSNFWWQGNPQLQHRVLKPESLPINLKVKGINL